MRLTTEIRSLLQDIAQDATRPDLAARATALLFRLDRAERGESEETVPAGVRARG